MKKKYLIFAVMSMIILVAVLTNPDQDRHKEVIRNELNSYFQQNMTESDDKLEQIGQTVGMMLRGAFIDGMINNLVSTDNYLLFSTTKITLDGKTKIIGIGAFGNVFLINKLNKVME